MKNSESMEEIRKLKEALSLLREKDSEWLEEYVGDSLDYLDSKSDDERNESSVNESLSSSSSPLSSSQQQPESNDEREGIDLNVLRQLGYDDEDIDCIKPNILKVIIEKKVERPKKGFPSLWLKNQLTSQQNDTNRQVVRQQQQQEKEKKTNSNDKQQRDRIQRSSSSNSNNKDNKEYSRVKPNEKTKSREKEEDSTDYKDFGNNSINVEDGLNFWPDLEEFKDMLLDESKFRVKTVGGWSTPFVKAETKWRYKIYKSWLNFLDQGLGSSFDDIPEGFYEDQIENDEIEDQQVKEKNKEDIFMKEKNSRRTMSKNGREVRDRFRWSNTKGPDKTIIEYKDNSSNDDDDDDDEDDDDDDQAEEDDEEEEFRPRKESNIPSSTIKIKLSPSKPVEENVRKISKAEAYQRKIQSQINENSQKWSDIRDDEREAQKILQIRESRKPEKISRISKEEWFHDDEDEEEEDDDDDDEDESMKSFSKDRSENSKRDRLEYNRVRENNAERIPLSFDSSFSLDKKSERLNRSKKTVVQRPETSSKSRTRENNNNGNSNLRSNQQDTEEEEDDIYTDSDNY